MSRNTRRGRDFFSSVLLSTVAVVLCAGACSGESSVPAPRFPEPSLARAAASRDPGEERHNEITQALFGLDLPTSGPFPADRFTVRDETQNTCKRVNLPTPSCTSDPNATHDCVELRLLNELDGFNLRPRISVPFSGKIDFSTVDSSTIFLVSLGSSLTGGVPSCLVATDSHEGDGDDEVVSAPGSGSVVGIDQGVWDPNTNTLYVEAAELLEQHTRYAVVVTRGVHDAAGESILPSKAFKQAIGDDDDAVVDPAIAAYTSDLRRAVNALRSFGVKRNDIAAASVFTTMSTSAIAEKIRDQVKALPSPSKANFAIGVGGARAVFALSTITKITFNRQLKTTGPLSSIDVTAGTTPTTVTLPVLRVIPGAISTVAYGSYESPNYQLSATDPSIPVIGTYSGTPVVREMKTLYFNVMVPSGTKPAAGWPVVIYGHGSDDTMNGAPMKVAANFASHGLATIGFNEVGAGFGPASTLTVARSDGPSVTFPFGGRAFDLNSDGIYGPSEGGTPVGTRRILNTRDFNRQNVADLIQLIRVLDQGVDIDGDRTNDLDSSRIYYSGQSAGTSFGMTLHAIEPRIRGTVLSSVGGWPSPEAVPANRGLLGQFLQSREPSLLNPPGTTVITELGGLPCAPPFFNENVPPRGQPPIVNEIAGALAIQDFLERFQWLAGGYSPGPFAPFVRLRPLAGVAVRPFMIQMPIGDQSIVNPSTVEMIEAGAFPDLVTLYRHDLFPQRTLFKNPHTFVLRTDNTVMRMIALEAQDQISAFFNGNGTMIDPDGAQPLFEAPAVKIPDGYGFTL